LIQPPRIPLIIGAGTVLGSGNKKSPPIRIPLHGMRIGGLHCPAVGGVAATDNSHFTLSLLPEPFKVGFRCDHPDDRLGTVGQAGCGFTEARIISVPREHEAGSPRV
jgi:hypothetical protein